MAKIYEMNHYGKDMLPADSTLVSATWFQKRLQNFGSLEQS